MEQQTYYYQDSMIKEFQSTIKHINTDQSGKHYIILENTAFYPTGGGQPHDTGTINGLEVVNVEKVDGDIRHFLQNSATLEIGQVVTGKLDWSRRFDHMQQHSGQHILTAAFVELFGFETLSFHLGKDYVAIDLNISSISEQQLLLAETRANEVILENRPIETKWVTTEELSQYPLRKEVHVDGDIRLVIIPDFDYNGCGGTHPTSTGQVQVLKIIGTEKMKQNIRVHFLCGNRVLQDLHKKTKLLSDVSVQLSVPFEETAEALKKVLTRAKETEKELQLASDELLINEAATLLSDATQQNSKSIIKLLSGRTMQQLQKLAKYIIAEDEQIAVALVGISEDKYQIVTARGKQSNVSIKKALQDVLPLIEGKGGGSDQLAQGGGAKLIDENELHEALVQAFQA